MADPRAFISFDFDHDNDQRVLFAGQAKNSKTPFDIEDWSSKDDLDQDKWEEIIEAKISKCHMVIVLCGKYMASATGVKKEIQMASKNNVPYFGVYIGGADKNSNLPEGLQRGRVVNWGWDDIANAIDQMMTEGKNK